MLCCWRIARRRDDEPDLAENDAFHAQFESQYDPHRNLVYNVNRDAEPDIVASHGHRRVVSQPQGGGEIMSAHRTQRSLGGDAPFGPRPTPDQLPAYSSRVNSPEPRVNLPPAALQPGGITDRERRSLGGRISSSDVRSEIGH